MIKSFKDFDLELNGQKVYEAFDDISNRKFKIEQTVPVLFCTFCANGAGSILFLRQGDMHGL